MAAVSRRKITGMEDSTIKVLMKQRPSGMLVPSDVFEVVDGGAAPTEESIPPGDVAVRNVYLSLDPAMRGWMDDAKSYLPPVGVGDVMRGGTLGVVTHSKNIKYAPGDLVSAMGGWQTHFVASGGRGLEKLEPGTNLLETVGPLGATGMTGYFGLLEVGKPVAGETIVVSGAAGATGSIVGQIGKIYGCRVVGLAGTTEKCRWLVDELQFDDAINYKAPGAGGLARALRSACPDGIDVYFDNTGGDILNEVLRRLSFNARVVLCGAISQYNSTSVTGPSNYLSLLTNRASMTGFIVFDYASRYPEARRRIAEWIRKGQLKYKLDIVDGLASAPTALLRLFDGSNVGKLVVQVSPPPRDAISKL